MIRLSQALTNNLNKVSYMANETPSTIPSAEQYEQAELHRACREITHVASAPLSYRKEAQASFTEALRDPARLAERLEWLINGDYGKGAQMMAQSILVATRSNRVARLSGLVASFEWHCPSDRARLAWKSLNKQEQQAIDKAIEKVISDYEEEQE